MQENRTIFLQRCRKLVSQNQSEFWRKPHAKFRRKIFSNDWSIGFAVFLSIYTTNHFLMSC